MTLQGVLAPNEAAPRGRVVRDLALVLVAGVLAVAAVAVDHADVAGGTASTAPPRLLAAGYALAAATVAVLSLWDRANRETVRRRAFRIYALSGLIMFGGQAVGYVVTSREPGAFDLRVEVIPLLIALPAAAVALFTIAWPTGMTRTDVRVAALDSAVAVLGLGIIWWQEVVPRWVYNETLRGWERLDQVVMFSGLCLVLVLGIVSRRIGSLPLVQIALLLGGLATYLLSDLAGQVIKGADDRTAVTGSIIGYVAALWLMVLFAHRPPIEPETQRARQGREWVSTSTPLVVALVAGLVIINDASTPSAIDVQIALAAAMMWVLLLLSVLLVRLRTTFELWRVEAGAVERVLAERTREGWFRALIGDSREFTFVLDAAGMIVYASPRVERDIALHDEPQPFDPTHRHQLHEVIVGGSAPEVRLMLAQVTLDESMRGPHDMTMRGHDGDLDLEVVVRPISDIEFQGYVVMARDVSDSRRLQRQLESSVAVDALTGLESRESFLITVQAQLDAVPTPAVAVLALNIERFGALNDSYGRDTGDAILVAVARVLEHLPREVCGKARLHSDTFAWLVVDPDPERLVGETVDQLRTELRGLLLSDGRELELTFRVGYVVQEDTSEDQPAASAERCLEAADLALARARASRHALLVEYHDEMRAETERRVAAERQLRWALAEDRFEVHYQPIVLLSDSSVHGAEALVRLRGQDGVLVPPGDFIPIAEQIGLIGEIGLVVLARACEQTRRATLLLGRPLHVSVNVSPDQLDAGLVVEVSRQLERSGLPPEQLTLEITEETLADLSPATQQVLHDLRALGVSVSLDDFGTGYSSMSYLATLPVDVLKIDRSFVSVMGTSAEGLTLARVVVQLASSLDLVTVAEGVETVEQADLLRGMNCQYGQGYLWSRPVPFDDYVAFLGGLGSEVDLRT